VHDPANCVGEDALLFDHLSERKVLARWMLDDGDLAADDGRSRKRVHWWNEGGEGGLSARRTNAGSAI